MITEGSSWSEGKLMGRVVHKWYLIFLYLWVGGGRPQGRGGDEVGVAVRRRRRRRHELGESEIGRSRPWHVAPSMHVQIVVKRCKVYGV